MVTICTPAKLSSVRWKPGVSSAIVGSGDYDGTVAEWDLENKLAVNERYEHGGQRVYSLDYSSWWPFLAASASGDGTIRLWNFNTGRSVGVIKSPGGSSVCCANFCNASHNMVAMACADSTVYVYDIRNLNSALVSLKHHSRAASYVRWSKTNKLVSASIDSSLKLWDISQLLMLEADIDRFSSSTEFAPERTFSAHLNVKNFVGLSVTDDGGLLACGSEKNEVFVYNQMTSDPVFRLEFPVISGQSSSPTATASAEARHGSFVGSVCWYNQGSQHSLLAGNSEGFVQLIHAVPQSISEP
ncbi:hypothetical protein O6H91_06G071200 [Diphasiastrum complanatum]|uniref:Uncharacterized protein n=1 Tax=Diphasiastrum complanatum TaxID=34168 RepID=A0ACC2DEQ0_DIPCM|nr:hypothetical protein O6H91_06G071200 [Diphasiastrum complanatum]